MLHIHVTHVYWHDLSSTSSKYNETVYLIRKESVSVLFTSWPFDVSEFRGVCTYCCTRKFLATWQTPNTSVNKRTIINYLCNVNWTGLVRNMLCQIYSFQLYRQWVGDLRCDIYGSHIHFVGMYVRAMYALLLVAMTTAGSLPWQKLITTAAIRHTDMRGESARGSDKDREWRGIFVFDLTEL